MLSCYSGATPGFYPFALNAWNPAEGITQQLTWKSCSALSNSLHTIHRSPPATAKVGKEPSGHGWMGHSQQWRQCRLVAAGYMLPFRIPDYCLVCT